MATTYHQLQLREHMHNLLKEQTDDDLRPISNTGEVKVPYHSVAWYVCSWCDGNITLRVPPKEAQQRRIPVVHFCRMCQSAVYCSVTCQTEDWQNGRHRHCCREVRRAKKAVIELSTELREENGVMDVFDRSNEMVFRLGAVGTGLGSVGQNYLRERMSLVFSLMEQAVAPMARQHHHQHWDKLALEFVFEHCMDMLHLDPVNASATARILILHCLLISEHYQELYDFVKYWNLLPHKLRICWENITEPTWFGDTLQFALGPNTFCSLKGPQSLWEDQSELALRPPSRMSSPEIETFPGPSKVEVLSVLYLALAKIQIYQMLLGVRLVAPCLPIDADDITSHIGSFLGLKSAWLSTDRMTIKQQCDQLLAFASKSIPGILRDLIASNTLPMEEQELHFEDDNPPMLDLLKTKWVSSNFAWGFLLQFVKNENNNHCQMQDPAHNFMLVLDAVYQQYLTEQSNRRIRERIRAHWNSVKDSPAVRQLLLEEMEGAEVLYDKPFSISRVYAALMKGQKLSPPREMLLLGVADSVDIVDEEVFLAKEHLLQVLHHPNVALFLQTHRIESIGEGVDLAEIVATLSSLGLATEKNLQLLFGNDGWVSLLLHYARVS